MVTPEWRERSFLDIAIEGSWLLAIALVPVAFSGPDLVVLFAQPKDFVLHLSALLILALWTFDWAFGGFRPRMEFDSWIAIRRSQCGSPRDWALVGAAGFGAAVFVSTLLSPLPIVSLWGRDFSQLGYDLYSTLSFLTIFFAIAVRAKSADQVKRIVLVIVATGVITSLYGIFQHFGWDPIGNGESRSRAISSFGNPIFFGSFLVMSVLITPMVALGDSSRRDLWRPAIAALFVGIQLAALWFTGSRGPWIGATVGVTAFGVLGALTLDRSLLIRTVGIFAAGLLVAILVASIPAPEKEELQDHRGLESVVSGVATGFGGRSDIWRGSVRLLDSWEVQGSESAAASALRPVFGLGPEMLFFSYPLTANPQTGDTVPSHAHNLLLQILLESGLAGLLTFTGLTLAVLITGLTAAYGHGQDRSGLKIVLVGVLAALIGRATEQMVGTARVGDMLAFWVLLGIVLVIHGILRSSKSDEDPQAETEKPRSIYVPVAAATVVVILASAIFLVRDVQMLRSGFTAANAFDEVVVGRDSDAIESLTAAAARSPGVEQYHVMAAGLLISQAQQEPDDDLAIPLLTRARDVLINHEEHNPLAYSTQLRLGQAEVELVNRGVDDLRNVLTARSLITADSMPSYPAVQAQAAERVLVAGHLELGLSLADRAIALETERAPQALAWFMRGNALGDLGDVDGALESFLMSLEQDPEDQIASAVHRNIALVYEQRGESDLAADHRQAADELDRRALTTDD